MSENKVIDEARQGEATFLETNAKDATKKLFIESYGCAMNFADSEIVASILANDGFATTKDILEADIIFVNTCAVRDNAEQRVRQRLHDFKKLKKNKPEMLVGVLGCMAERLKSQLLEEEKTVDMVVGPDAYRDLPNLIKQAGDGHKAVNVILSKEETYADISPVKLNTNGVTAFISITRGCDNMCAFCVVPFTRGRERSRSPETVVKEATELFKQGFREVTLLGQNVDSYLWVGGGLKKEATQEQLKSAVSFANLLEMVALISPLLRVRFSTSHPKDLNNEVIYTMAKYENICNYIHLPVQSGSNQVLEMMNRGYTREWYMERINKIREVIPDCGISTDTISGFCSETDENHKDTLSLMEFAKYDFAYMFKYSERPKTQAERQFKDDVPEEVKSKRLSEIIELQSKLSHESNLRDLNKTFKILVEGYSKKSKNDLQGRNDQNKTVVFPKENYKPGDYVTILVTECTTATLMGVVVE